MLIIGPGPFISQSGPDHSPLPRIDFSYYEISGPDICSLICVLYIHAFFFCCCCRKKNRLSTLPCHTFFPLLDNLYPKVKVYKSGGEPFLVSYFLLNRTWYLGWFLASQQFFIIRTLLQCTAAKSFFPFLFLYHLGLLSLLLKFALQNFWANPLCTAIFLT